MRDNKQLILSLCHPELVELGEKFPKIVAYVSNDFLHSETVGIIKNGEKCPLKSRQHGLQDVRKA